MYEIKRSRRNADLRVHYSSSDKSKAAAAAASIGSLLSARAARLAAILFAKKLSIEEAADKFQRAGTPKPIVIGLDEMLKLLKSLHKSVLP
jgi:hypothetical protein